MEFDKVPDLGDKIIVNGRDAWIISISNPPTEDPVDKDFQYYGTYTFKREQYFK